MADTITILTHGAQPNAVHEMSGQTPVFVGWSGGHVLPSHQVKSTPVDVSAYSSMRIKLSVDHPTCKDGGEPSYTGLTMWLQLEHQTPEGVWETLYAFAPIHSADTRHVPLAAFHGHVRASWFWARSYVPSTITDRVQFSFGITAECLPETPEN